MSKVRWKQSNEDIFLQFECPLDVSVQPGEYKKFDLVFRDQLFRIGLKRKKPVLWGKTFASLENNVKKFVVKDGIASVTLKKKNSAHWTSLMSEDGCSLRRVVRASAANGERKTKLKVGEFVLVLNDSKRESSWKVGLHSHVHEMDSSMFSDTDEPTPVVEVEEIVERKETVDSSPAATVEDKEKDELPTTEESTPEEDLSLNHDDCGSYTSVDLELPEFPTFSAPPTPKSAPPALPSSLSSPPRLSTPPPMDLPSVISTSSSSNSLSLSVYSSRDSDNLKVPSMVSSSSSSSLTDSRRSSIAFVDSEISPFQEFASSVVPPYLSADADLTALFDRIERASSSSKRAMKAIEKYYALQSEMMDTCCTICDELSSLASTSDTGSTESTVIYQFRSAREGILHELSGAREIQSDITTFFEDLDDRLEVFRSRMKEEKRLRHVYEDCYRKMFGSLSDGISNQGAKLEDAEAKYRKYQDDLHTDTGLLLFSGLNIATPLADILTLDVNNATTLSSNLLPLSSLLSHQGKKSVLLESASGGKSADDNHKHYHDASELIGYAIGAKLFKDFLEYEHNSENLLFITAVDRYKRQFQKEYDEIGSENIPENMEQAMFGQSLEIHTEFLDSGSQYEVNISDRDRNSVKKALEHPTPYSFDLARESVMALLEKDALPRFVQSSFAKTLEELTGLKYKPWVVYTQRKSTSSSSISNDGRAGGAADGGYATGSSDTTSESGADSQGGGFQATGSSLEEAATSKSSMVSVMINNKMYSVPEGNILNACRSVDIYVPSLCYHPRLSPLGKCKSCIVSIHSDNAPPKTVTSCTTIVRKSMRIMVGTEDANRMMLSGISSMLTKRNNRSLPMIHGLSSNQFELVDLLKHARVAQKDVSNHAIMRDMSLCLECGRCVQACRELQAMSIYTINSESTDHPLQTHNGLQLQDTMCIGCGQCTVFCPSGALSEVRAFDDFENVASNKVMIALVAPSVRVALGEGFGFPVGQAVTGKIVTALRQIGFEYVFDLQFGADLTIMEEATELLGRLAGRGVLPMFTSCCAGWVNLVEKSYPRMIQHLSSCRSPQQMLGAIIKSFFAEKLGVSPWDICVCSFSPCTAKKQESRRPQMTRNGIPDVDIVFTTRETIDLFQAKLAEPFKSLDDGEFDDPLGHSTGAAALFSNSGGVMEAALRTAYELKTKEKFPELQYSNVRGLDHLKEATLTIGGRKLKVAVVSGGTGVRSILEKIMSSECSYDFVEVMMCPGGCIGGGGQPRSYLPNVLDTRMGSVYSLDASSELRCSHQNPAIRDLYETFLGSPNSERSHVLLHTSYSNRAAEIVTTSSAMHVPPLMTYEMNRKKSKRFNKKRFVVLYASQTGTTVQVAKYIADDLESHGNKVDCCRLDVYPFENLATENCFVIFATSTFWDGDFPENGQLFWRRLRHLERSSTEFNIKNLAYASFGLGNSSYQHFNSAVTKLDDKLQELGCRSICPFGMADCEKEDAWLKPLDFFLSQVRKAQLSYHHANVAPDAGLARSASSAMVRPRRKSTLVDAGNMNRK